MGLLDRLFSPLQTKASKPGLFSVLTGRNAPDPLGPELLDAYRGWVYACVNAIAEEIAAIDLRLERRDRDGWHRVDDHISLGPLHKVNDLMSSYDLFLGTQAFLDLEGNAFWWTPPGRVVRKPLEIWPLDPTRVFVVKSESKVIGGYVYRNEKGQDIPLKAEEIIHFKRFNPRNRYRGIGTVQAAAIAIDSDVYSAKWNRNFFYNAAMPSAVLETKGTLSEEQYTRIRANWEGKYQGIDNAHKTAILEGGLTFKPASPTQKDMEFLEGRRWNRDEIMGIFRVSKTILGITEDVNRANAEASDYVFAKRVVKPRMRFLAETLTERYLPLFGLNQGKQDYRFEFTDPVPQNTELDITRRQIAISTGQLTPNEAREEEGKDPIPGGEKAYLPGNLIPLDAPNRGALPIIGAPGQEPKDDKKKTVTKSASDTLVAGRISFLTKQITKYQSVYQSILLQQRDALTKKLGGKSKAVTGVTNKDVEEKERLNELVRFLFTDWEDWIGVLVNPTRDALQESLEFGGRNALGQMDVEVNFDQLDPNVMDWLNSNALRHATSVTGTVKEELITRLMAGVEQGLSAREIADSFSEFFDSQSQWRALRIARTEVISGYAEGALAGYRQSGLVKMKQWLTAGEDGRTDVDCLMNEAQGAIPLDSTFPSGHISPPLHPNCRCRLVPVTSENG